MSEIEHQSKVEFLDPCIYYLNIEIKEVLISEEKHNEEELKDLEKHKYNSKHFVFHNIDLIRSYIDQKKMKSINIEQIQWKKINLPSKTGFDCRNKFIQIMQVLYKNNEDLDLILI